MTGTLAPGAAATRPMRAGRALAAAVVVLAVVPLVGWYTGHPGLASMLPDQQPMVPNTALALVLLGGGFLLHDAGPRARVVARSAAAAAGLLGAVMGVELALGRHLPTDVLLPGIDLHGDDPQMARATALAITLLSVGKLLRGTRRAWVVQPLCTLSLLGAYVAVVGYLYGAAQFSELGGYTRMAMPTAVAVGLMSVAVLLQEARSPLAVLIRDRGSAGRLVRGLLPFLVAAPPLVGWLRLEGQARGWYDTRFGVSILITVLTVTSTALLVRTALQVQRLDASRQVALHRVHRLNEDLEQLVLERTGELSAAQARFRAAFDSSPMGGALTSLDGTVEEVNRLLLQLTERRRADVVGTDVASLFDDDLTDHEAELRERLLDGSCASYTLERCLRRDGSPCWVQVSVALVRGGDGPTGLVLQMQDVTGRRLAEDRAEHLALHDALTDLPNRVLLLDRLRQALARGARTHRGVGVLFLDLDRFKVVNDSLGHHAGDLVLVEVASRLRRTARAVDTVARLGGDEFVVLMTDATSTEDVLAFASLLREVVSRPMDLEGTAADVDVSIGIAFGLGHEDPEALLRRADQAMYRAKDRGRARAEVFDDDLHLRITQRLDTELALRGAPERGEIETWFQPIVDLQDERVVAAEALVRWRRPGRGLVLPGEFVQVAEEVGLIKELGRTVLRQALSHAVALPDGPAVSINVSPRQFVRADFQAVVEEALAETGLPPQRLWLELTESAIVDAMDSAARSFRALRDQGVRIAVDDFGTGFSSFAHLRHFPVDLVKVDMTFIADITTSARDRAIVEGILRMADALHLDVVGEGIETPAQRDLLRIFGCRYGQGYLYARPAPGLLPAYGGAVPVAAVPLQRVVADERVEQG